MRVNKPAYVGLNERRMGKFTSKDSWFKDIYTSEEEELTAWEPQQHPHNNPTGTGTNNPKTKCTIPIESIIFVPATHNSSLTKTLQKIDDEFVRMNNLNRCRFIERNGLKLIDLLGCKDPWGKTPCERTECWSCKDEDSMGCCRTEGVTYSILCLGCLRDGLKAEYSGEISRTLYQRGQEHLRDLDDKLDESPLWKHCVSQHNSTVQEFQLKLLSKHKTAFTRQIAESVHISHGKRDMTLNSKAEWMGSTIFAKAA